MNLLCCDLGVHTGWAAWQDGTGLTSGMQTFTLERGESPGMRFLRFRSFMDEMVSLVKPKLIAWEKSFLMPTAQTSMIHLNFAGIIETVCALYGIEHTSVNAMKLKKWTTGYGRASKEDMVKHVCERWKPGITDHDEADAVALLHYVLSQLPKETP